MSTTALLSWDELRHFDRLQVPIWVFDTDRMRLPWANAAGLACGRPAAVAVA